MNDEMGRRSFLRMAGMSLGIGVVYQFAPLLAQKLEAGAITDFLKDKNVRRQNPSPPPSSAIPMSGFRVRPTRLVPKRLKLQWS
jgi:hypothetical protein